MMNAIDHLYYLYLNPLIDANKYSTIAAWSLAIARALAANKVDPQQVFAEVGLNLQQLESAPNSRIAIEQMTSLWGYAQQVTNNEAFGLCVGQYAYPIHFSELGSLLINSKTLAAAFETLPHYGPLVSNSAAVSLQRTPTLLGFTITPLNSVEISHLAIDAFFASLMLLGKQMIGQQALVKKVELQKANVTNPATWETFFNANVDFNQTQNCMWMDRTILEQPVAHRDQHLAEQKETSVQQYLTQMQSLSWREKTSQGIHTLLVDQQPNAAKIAQMFNISERTLSRYLQVEGCNFRQLLANKRLELAHHYLVNTPIAINCLSDTLGYTSVSNFSRSFQKWTGQSPGCYRKQHQQNRE
ncbi:AraC family transcriptional regulator [Shewanella sp. Scap07]|uniref:AraC family transcriptional regulator n=1 Tax=Shewanella sp. Scap07 TaxID=2589987 RepID=UPI00211833A3|nr:AraC family transcriptional regulator [Shewanella sp. Scap07]